MRTQSRRAPLLAACAFALAVSLSAAADEAKPIAAVAVPQVTVQAISGSLSTPQGELMAAELAALEKALIKHLKGEQPTTFEALDRRRKELKVRIDAVGLVPGDKKVLDDRLARSASVIARSLRLTGGARLLDPEISKAVASAGAVPNAAEAKDPLYQIDVLLGDLDRASANPAEAEKIFDALNRRYGTPKGASGAVAVDFGAIRKTLEVTYTPKGAPGTNAAKARDLGRDTPAPAQEPVIARGESVDYAALLSLSGGRAANMIAEKLPDGAERRFVAERGDRLKELLDAGRLAVSAMGGDPNAFASIDALVAHLSRQEQDLADSMRLGNNFESMDDMMLRIAAVKSVNRELGAFMATLWEYRAFLRGNLVKAQVPLNAMFTPWETFPDGQGTAGAQVVGLNRGVSQFVGLRYDNPDGSSRFQGQGRDGMSGLIVVLDKAKKRAESLIGYDGEGKVRSALTEMYDGDKLTRRERLNMGTGIVEITDYKADGGELKSTRQNSKTGEQFVRDLSGRDERFEATTRDGRRETRFLANADGAPPAISLRVEKVGTDGIFELERLVLQNGTHIVAKSPHVNQLLENGTKNLGWEVALKSLVDATDGKKRLTVGRALARETISALGLNDGNERLSKPMGAFLAAEAKDTGDLIDPRKGAPIRFFINENKSYLLIFTRRDGTKRILSGTFKQSTEFENEQGLGTAFGVSGEIEIDAAGNARQNDPKIDTEYLADGSRLVWLPVSPSTYTPTTNLGWLGKHEMPWTNEHEKTELKVRRDLPPDPSRAEWNPDGREWVSPKDTIDREINGTSVLGTGSRWAASVPGVKQVLGVCGDAASTMYTGIVSGGQRIAYQVTGIEEYNLEATAGDSRNPGIKLLMGGLEPDPDKDPKAWRAWKEKMNAGHLAHIGGGDNREILDIQARARREKALASQGITERRAPQAYRDAMKAPVSDDERYDAFSDFGAGSYGRRLAEDGHDFWGGAMVFGESLGEGMLNPLMYVIPGIGRLAGAAGKVGLSAASPTVQVVAKVAEFGLLGFQYALLGSVVGSFSLSALDNIGKISDYWGTPGASVKAGEAMADLAFGGMMIHGFAKERTRDRLAELKNLGDANAPVEVKATAVEAAAKAVQSNLSAKAEAAPAAKASGAKVDVKVEVPAAPAVEAAAAKGPPPGTMARMNSLASTFWSELKRGGDAFSEKAREELRSSDVKSPTHAEANAKTGTAALDAKGAELKTAKVTALEAKASEAAAPEAKTAQAKAKTKGKAAKSEVKGEVSKAEVKGETKGKTKAEVKEKTARIENFKDEKRGLANVREEGKTAARAEVLTEANGEVALKEKPGRFRRAARWLGEKGRALGERAERGSRWIEKRPVTLLARGGVMLPITPAMTRNMAEPDADRNRNARKDPPPPKKENLETVEEPAVAPVATSPQTPKDDAAVDNPDDASSNKATAPDDRRRQDPPANNTDSSGSGPGAGAGAASGGDGGGPAGKGPKAPKFGGFGGGGEGGGGGGGGGGPAGNGADGGGAGGGSDSGGKPGVGPHAGGPSVSADQPANLFGGGPVIPVNRGMKSVPNDTSAGGGHSPSPSLASRFDGSRQQPASANSWSATPMKGLGAGDSPGLPRLMPRAAALVAPAASDDGALAARTAGGSVGPARAGAGAPGVRPEEEDFNYTYMAPARHKYELPTDRPADEKDWRYLLSLGLRGAAALAIGYLIYHSDLPYLVGLTRRRRDGTYGA